MQIAIIVSKKFRKHLSIIYRLQNEMKQTQLFSVMTVTSL